MHFYAHVLHDGTVLASFPIRKPSKRGFHPGRVRNDPDGVAIEHADAGENLRDVNNDTRTRFQDIISTNLNTRRALRELLLPSLADVLNKVQALQGQLDRIEAMLKSESVHLWPPVAPDSAIAPFRPATERPRTKKAHRAPRAPDGQA
jgi:hypothetical protein